MLRPVEDPFAPDGGMRVDGVLLRHAPDHFWFVQADGDLFPWLIAHAQDLDVAISDPGVFVSQVQGPCSAGGPRSRSRWGTVG